jgi:hypothetical protein
MVVSAIFEAVGEGFMRLVRRIVEGLRGAGKVEKVE